MTLENLLEGVSFSELHADKNREVSSLKIDSRKVCDGDLFFCMEGVRDDGNRYVEDIDADFVAITEKRPSADVEYVLVDNVRAAYALMSRNFFLRPSDGMKFVAVVGTNGKTSTAHYISSLLAHAGVKTGLIGTEGHYILGEKAGESLTTPDSFELNELLFKMRAKGVEVVVSEVSAHAIRLDKLCGIKADIAVFTNLSQDHLDYFKSYENYKKTKFSYFTAEHVAKAVVNTDDAAGRELAAELEKTGLPFVTYALENPADCFAVNVEENIDGVRFLANLCDDLVDVRSGLYGEFNVYNLLAALTAAHELGLDAETLFRCVRKVKAVRGRFSVLHNEKGTIIIDYAHTPDGLEKLLRTARTLTKSRLIAVFGCGGERDKSKRAVMGKIAEKLSDVVIVTSDNPRFENPSDIICDIVAGMQSECKTFVDRTEAIAYAVSEMLEGDTVVIAGKGNENYLEIRGKRIPYSDFETARRWGQAR